MAKLRYSCRISRRAVLSSSGSEREQKDALQVLTLLNRGRHWVLVCLLLSNVVVNESLRELFLCLLVNRRVGHIIDNEHLNFYLQSHLPRLCSWWRSRSGSTIYMLDCHLWRSDSSGSLCSTRVENWSKMYPFRIDFGEILPYCYTIAMNAYNLLLRNRCISNGLSRTRVSRPSLIITSTTS